MRIFAAGLAVLLSTVFMLNANTAGDKKDEKPKFTIKQVMAKAHAGKNALRKKVLDKEATDEEKAQLTVMYVALSQAKPPAGEEEAWKKRTKAILDAYKNIDEEGGLKAYAKATDCASCHGEFKPKKKVDD